jgi:hypothetical protein
MMFPEAARLIQIFPFFRTGEHGGPPQSRHVGSETIVQQVVISGILTTTVLVEHE